jgi:hypothetical protein
LRYVENPTLCRQLAVKLSALRSGRAVLPRNMIFLIRVLISVRTPGSDSADGSGHGRRSRSGTAAIVGHAGGVGIDFRMPSGSWV